jgi:hypothetical protein
MYPAQYTKPASLAVTAAELDALEAEQLATMPASVRRDDHEIFKASGR